MFDVPASGGRRRYRAWAIYKQSDAYKPGLIRPAVGETRPLPDKEGLRPPDWRRRQVGTLTQAARYATALRRRVEHAVATARLCGATWTQVGHELGVTKQAAWSRYRRLDARTQAQRDAAQLRVALNTLRFIGERARDVDSQIRKLVHDARTAGQSWHEIASQLGIQRQTAWEQFRSGVG
jgi:hypothetical protein